MQAVEVQRVVLGMVHWVGTDGQKDRVVGQEGYTAGATVGAGQ